MKTLYLLAAASAVGAMAVPASAQQAYPYPYAQPVPQPYPGQPGYGYPQQAYPQGYGYSQQGYAQPYGANPVEQIINQLLGNRYNVSDRTAVSRCASAAIVQAQAQYRPGYNGYGYSQPYANNGYNNAYSQMRVSSITEVRRLRNSGLQVQGRISSGAYASPYGNAYGYQGQRYDPRYAQGGDMAFRCNVDYRGAISGLRVTRATVAYRR